MSFAVLVTVVTASTERFVLHQAHPFCPPPPPPILLRCLSQPPCHPQPLHASDPTAVPTDTATPTVTQRPYRHTDPLPAFTLIREISISAVDGIPSWFFPGNYRRLISSRIMIPSWTGLGLVAVNWCAFNLEAWVGSLGLGYTRTGAWMNPGQNNGTAYSTRLKKMAFMFSGVFGLGSTGMPAAVTLLGN